MSDRQTREERLRRMKQYHALAYQNGGRTTVDAAEIVPLLRELNQRMSRGAIGDALGTSHSYVGAVLRGEIRSVGLDRAAAIRAICPTQPVPNGAHVSALASTRRLQALAALGYSAGRLATHLGLSVKTIKLLTTGRRTVMHGRTERHIAAVYERLLMELPQAADKYEAGSITRTRRRAKREGWLPPLAWDNIDDPNEQPTVARDTWDEDSIDDAVIDRVLAGGKRPRKLTKAEAGEIVARSVARGMTGGQIEAMYGLKPERYWRDGERVA